MSTQAEQPMSWQNQLLDVLSARARTWFVVSILLILLAALLSLLAPGTLPPTPFVGLVIGLAAVLLATAVVFGLDISDVIVRGRRHVEIAGGTVAGTISRATSDIDALIDLIDRHAEDGKVRVALTPASRSAGVPGSRANIVATELAGRGAKVLVTDLTRGGTPAVGLSDVIAGDRTLGEAVRFDDELYLAHLAVGSEPELALEGFSGWSRGLPPDLDVLVAALPPLSEPGVLAAVDGVELLLLLVEVGRTERVDLIASLDAIDAADVPAELVLVDDDAVVTRATGSGSVEVLSTPGSSPRQRDPEGFDLQDGVALVDPDTAEADTTTADGSDTDATTPSSRPDTPGGSGSSSAAGRGAGAAAGVAAGAAGVGTSAGDKSADRTEEATSPTSDDDEADSHVVEPGGGHVRTVRPRPAPADAPLDEPVIASGDDTVAMSADELPGGGAPLAGGVSASRPETVPEDAPAPTPDAVPDEPMPDPIPRADLVGDDDADRSDRTPAGHTYDDGTLGDAGGHAPDRDPAPVGQRDVDPVGSTYARSDASPDTVVDGTDPAPTQRLEPADRPGARSSDPTSGVPADVDAPTDAVTDDDDVAGAAATDPGADASSASTTVTPESQEASKEPTSERQDPDEDEDPIDAVAREQQRLSASLQQLAQDVWRRGDGA